MLYIIYHIYIYIYIIIGAPLLQLVHALGTWYVRYGRYGTLQLVNYNVLSVLSFYRPDYDSWSPPLSRVTSGMMSRRNVAWGLCATAGLCFRLYGASCGLCFRLYHSIWGFCCGCTAALDVWLYWAELWSQLVIAMALVAYHDMLDHAQHAYSLSSTDIAVHVSMYARMRLWKNHTSVNSGWEKSRTPLALVSLEKICWCWTVKSRCWIS